MDIIALLSEIEQIRQKSQTTDTSKIPVMARSKIEERDRVNQANAKTRLTELLDEVYASQDVEEILYFKQLVVGYGLGELLPDRLQLDSAPHPDSIRWGAHYNHSLYQKILPVCQLAYLKEKNGIAEEHALKLSLIFNDEKAVYAYLMAQDQSDYPIHDACLFDLPDAATCNFSLWKQIANKKTYMTNPRFRELLPNARAIENIAAGQKVKSFNRKEFTRLENEARVAHQNYRDLEKTPVLNPTEEDKTARTKKLMELSKIRSDLNIRLAEMSKGMSLQDVSITVLHAFYESYRMNSNAAHKILVENGVSQQNIELFYSLQRENDDQLIPAIFIKGSDIGYSNYYLTKLDTQSDIGAALAASLGRITKCCQYLGGVGSECAQYGIQSPKSGFYVMFQGDERNPSLNDNIVAQAWVWADENGSLCLDSVESIRGANRAQIADFYRYLGMRLCEDFDIKQVNTGAQSGITSQVALENYPTTKLHSEYKGYSDASSQLLLTDATMPYIFMEKVSSDLLQLKITKKTDEYFKGLFQRAADLTSNEDLRKAINYMIYSDQADEDKPFYQLLLAAAGNRTEELLRLIEVNRSYIHYLNENELDLAFTLLEQGAYINTMNSSGQSLLHMAVLTGNRPLLEKLAERNINLDICDKNGKTALIVALETKSDNQKSEDRNGIALYLLEKGANVDIKDNSEFTPLIYAVAHQDLDMVRYLLEKGADPNICDSHMVNALYYAALKGYWAIYSELSKTNCKTDIIGFHNDENLLMAAIRGGNTDIIRHIINTEPVDFFYQNTNGQTVLHMVARNSELMDAMISLLHPDTLIRALCVRNSDGYPVLHSATQSSLDSLKRVLESIPEAQRLEALSIVNPAGDNVLHAAKGLTQSIVDLVPSLKNSPLLGAVNNKGDTILHRVLDDPSTLRTLLELMSETQRFEVLTKCNEKGQSVLSLAVDYPNSLRIALEFLTEQQRVDAVSLADQSRAGVLRRAANNVKSLEVIYALFPENQKPEGFGGPNHQQVLSELSREIARKEVFLYDSFEFEYGLEETVSENNVPAASSGDLATDNISSNDEFYEKLRSILDNPDFIEPGVKLKSQLYPNLYKLKQALDAKEPFSVIQKIAAKGVEKNNKIKEAASPETLVYIDRRLDLLRSITEAHDLEQTLEYVKEKLPEICLSNQRELH